jgi:hypothetical protein
VTTVARTYSLVALLDVLSYKNHIAADRTSGTESFKGKLEAALAVLTSINETELTYQAISDTIIIAANPSAALSDFLSTIGKVQRAFLSSGLLIRGGLAFEQHFKSGNLTYSHALAIAYDLEQKQAVYPRVVVDESVIEMLCSGSKFTTEDIKQIQDQRLICVQNGIHFVNFLDNHVEQCYEAAKNVFESEQKELHGREAELAKHRWLQDYIFSAASGRWPPYMGGITAFTLAKQ